ncbi:MAG: hypothetical protein IT445_13615 [Phycisphaeraceae bacterium]|nr:hypothetical protein [Phycisphaeraceae bacterium]
MSEKSGTFSQGINVAALVLILLVGAVATYVTVVGVQAYYEAAVLREQQTKLIQPLYQPLIDLKESQISNLTTVGWVQKETGLARVPIEEGMQKVIEKYGKP